MIKITAVSFIVFGFAVSGFYFSSVYEKKTEILNSVVSMVTAVKTQLRYAHLPVSSILVFLQENRSANSLRFISECSERMGSGESFADLWQKSIENEKELCKLIPESVPHLIRFGRSLGTTDLEGQISCCEYYERIFAEELNEKTEQCKKYSKLFPTLGIMLGISVAIMII